MNCTELARRFAVLPIPQDYFQGIGEVLFSPPYNILMFYRNRLSIRESDLKIRYPYRHYRHLLILNTGVPIQLQLDSENIDLDFHSCIIVFPYQYHRFMLTQKEGFSLIFISFEMSDDLFLESFRYLPLEFSEHSIQLANDALEAFLNNDNRKISLLLTSLLLDVTDCQKSVNEERRGKIHSGGMVGDICRQVSKHKSCTIKELSHKMGYSESYLRKAFKKSMGIPLGQYIIEVRLSAAMYYLTRSNQLISEIAELVGYDSVYSLSRAFKVHIGISPSAYRFRAQSSSVSILQNGKQNKNTL